MDSAKYRVFRCASCSAEFRKEANDREIRCVECGGKVLILLEGESLARKKCAGCSASSCSSCSACGV